MMSTPAMGAISCRSTATIWAAVSGFETVGETVAETVAETVVETVAAAAAEFSGHMAVYVRTR